MSILLRILLVSFSILTFLYIIKKIRKEQIKIKDTLFWIFISIFLIVLSIMPEIAFWAAQKLDILSPVNFIFLLMIFLLLFKVFTQSIRISQIETKLEQVAQSVALERRE